MNWKSMWDQHRTKLLMAVGAVVVVAGWTAAGRGTPVELARVSRGDLTVTVAAAGYSRSRDRLTVVAPSAGIFRPAALQAGAAVTQGQMLGTLSPSAPALLDSRARAEAESQLKAAQAGRQEAATALEALRLTRSHAEQECQRIQRLVDIGAKPGSALDQAVLERDRARAQVREGESALDKAEWDVSRARSVLAPAAGSKAVAILAPRNSRILRVMEAFERLVPANAPLLELGGLEPPEVLVHMPSTDAISVAAGQPVEIRQWGGSPLRGVVRVRESSGYTRTSPLGIEEQHVNVLVDPAPGAAEAWQPLADGFYVEAAITLQARKNVLKLPVSALVRHQDGWAALAVRQGKAVLCPLQIGARGEREAEVLSGLAEGDLFVLYPGDHLRPGSTVRPKT